MREAMTIGRLAKAAGVNVETVRYYQRRGLIGEPSKPPGGHRRYPVSVVGQLAFIRRAQQLGFSLEEVKSLLELSDGRSCRKACLIAEQKFAVLGVRVAQLNLMRRKLKRVIKGCKNNKGRAFCPFIQELSKRD